MVIDKICDVEMIFRGKRLDVVDLEVRGIDLRGRIFEGFLKGLPKLQSLRLSFCRIDVLPEPFGSDSSGGCCLESLELDNNEIEKWNVMGAFPNLKYLDLSRNKIRDPTGIIDLFKRNKRNGCGGEIMILNLEYNNIEFIDLKVLERVPHELMIMLGGNPIVRGGIELDPYKENGYESLFLRGVKRSGDKIVRNFCNRCSNRLSGINHEGCMWGYCKAGCSHCEGNNILRVKEKLCHSCSLTKNK